MPEDFSSSPGHHVILFENGEAFFRLDEILRPILAVQSNYEPRRGYPIEMSLGYDIYEDIGLLYIRGQGEITQHQRMSTMLAWLREPKYQDCHDALMDLAGVKTTPKVAEMRELIAMLKQHRPARGPRRLAMVTTKPITFIVARMFEHLVRSQGLPFEIKVFMTLGRAWDWLRPEGPAFHVR